jgi:hypothetical protein
MLSMEDLRENAEITACLNMEMTPEKAVALYLEWGSSWAHGKALPDPPATLAAILPWMLGRLRQR